MLAFPEHEGLTSIETLFRCFDVLCNAAVPFFFMASAYIFFAAPQKPYMALALAKLRRLGVPMLLFGLIAAGVAALYPHLGELRGHNVAQMLQRCGPWVAFWSVKVNAPLWFVQDLLLFFLVSPLIVPIFQRVPWWLALLAAVALRGLACAHVVPGEISSNAILHLYLGFLLARMDVDRWIGRLDGLSPALLVALVAVPMALFVGLPRTGGLAVNLLVAAARELTFLALILAAVRWAGLRHEGCRLGLATDMGRELASLSMFVYCAHDAGPLDLAAVAIDHFLAYLALPGAAGLLRIVLIVALRTLLTLAMLVPLGLLLRRRVPHVYALLTGERPRCQANKGR